MGQQTSREHAPLTFGYVNRSFDNDQDDIEDKFDHQEFDQDHKDFVLANPHLYQLQTICKQCNRQSLSPKREVVVSLVGEACPKCQKQKRLSLVRKDLANDLEYIDQTYYPDLVHYTEQDPMEEELLQLEKGDDTLQQQWDRLTIGEVTTPGRSTVKRRPRGLTGPSMAVDLSNRSLIKLGPSIGYLDGLTKLNLSNNQMTALPRELGYLKNLRVLNISYNAINELPDTIAFLSKLKALNCSHNKLVELPVSIGNLPKLVIIIANNNNLVSLPRELAHLTNLISLNISNNPLKYLPAEIASLGALRKLLTDDCPFKDEHSYELQHNPPSLLETCARIAVRSKLDIPNGLADHLKDYLSRADTCSHCKDPFFDSHVTRVRFIERRARQAMVLKYTLCSAHWSNEDDRLLSMFSSQPINTNRTHKNFNMDGLQEVSTTRNRAYSDSTANYHYNSNSNSSSNLSPPLVSSPLSKRSNSNASDYPPDNDYLLSTTPISLLKSQPELPALPQEPFSSSSLLSPRGNRPRASSAASVSKRFTNFIRSNSSTSLSRARSPSNSSSSSLRPYRNDTTTTLPTHLQQRPVEVYAPTALKNTLQDWENSIQVATTAAEETIATQQQQNQIEHFLSKNSTRLRQRTETS